MSPLRWADPRIGFDPDADAGLPRPFLLEGDKVRFPKMLHTTRQPSKKPAPVKQQYIPPYKALKFYDLPDKDPRTKHIKDPRTRMGVLDAKAIAYYRRILVGAWGHYAYVDLLKGAHAHRVGWFVMTLDIYGKPQTFTRVPEEFQRVLSGKAGLTTEQAQKRYMLFLWNHDRVIYRAARKLIMAQRAAAQDDHRRKYDDWVANVKNARAQAQYQQDKAWREYKLKAQPRW